MGQLEIGKILKNNFPNYLSYLDLMKLTNTNKQSVHRCLRQMKKRNEVEMLITWNPTKKSGWITKYRIKE